MDIYINVCIQYIHIYANGRDGCRISRIKFWQKNFIKLLSIIKWTRRHEKESRREAGRTKGERKKERAGTEGHAVPHILGGIMGGILHSALHTAAARGAAFPQYNTPWDLGKI